MKARERGKPAKAAPTEKHIVKLSPQTVGNVGLYFVCYRLSLLGWNVMPTTRNARGVDVLIYSQDGLEKLSLQVKALSQRAPVPLGGSLEKIAADYWIICTRAVSEEPLCLIMRPSEVKRLAHKGEKDGRVSYWLQPQQYDTGQFREQWVRIGQGHGRRTRVTAESAEASAAKEERRTT
jgi:hypothetical protein